MVEADSRLARRTLGSGSVASVGVLSLALHVAHLAAESSASLLGAALPMAFSLALASVGVWLYRSDLADQHVFRVARWTGLGALAGVLLGFPVVPFQATHGVEMEQIPFVVLTYLVSGALGGVLVGYYDARQHRYRDDLRENRDELVAREADLERENDRLDTFASLVSHDLRNPLNVAAGHVDLARETGDPSHLDEARAALDRMDTIVEDILTITRDGDDISADELETVSLVTVAETAWADCETGAADLVADDDVRLLAKPSSLASVFENLFRNAAEHGSAVDGGDAGSADDDRGLTVRVGSLPSGSGFYVEDDGDGFTADAPTERLLEAGYTTAEEGTGLGLYIVRTIADAHGWEVALSESASGGARFEFTDVDVP